MKRLTVALLSAVLALGAAGAAQADLITVDPDDFAPGALLTDAFAGLTLSSIGPGFDGDFDSDIFGTDSSAQPLEAFDASTGDLVFGTNDSTFPHLFGGYGAAQFRVDFDFGVSTVSLDGIGNDGFDFAQFQAFTSGGVLLDTYLTGQLGVSSFESMVVSSAAGDIGYVVASGVGGDSVGFDHLQYETVPEPAILTLLGAGLGLLALWRRRTDV